MKKIILFIAVFLLPISAYAGISYVVDAKITKIEFYGNQFTVSLDKVHSSKGCGHPGNVVAIHSATEPGKTHYSALLAIWMGGKTVNMSITDANCSGDRPTLLNWSAN